MPTFDGDNLIITLDSGVTEVDVVADIYSPWKDWMLASPLNRRHAQAFRSDGGNPLSSIINQGSYIFLNNTAGWRIRPPEEDITVYLTGNLAVEDTVLPAFIPTIGAFTAAILGLQPVTQGVTPVMAQQLLHGAFNGGVWFDAINGDTLANIGDEGGTEKYPLNNFTDVLAVSESEGFNTVFVIGDAIVDAGLDYQDKVFVGQGLNLSVLTISAAAQVFNCSFENAEVTGTLDGDSHIEDCIVDGLNFVSGVLTACILNPGTILLGGSSVAHFIDCQSGEPGLGTPVIDCGGSGQGLALRNYNGGVTITNKTGVDAITVDLNSGQVILTSTVTNGVIVVRGVGKLIDEAGDRIPTGTWNGATIVNETIDSLDLQLARKLMSNKVIIAADDLTTTIYDDDDLTVLWTFTHTGPRNRAPV